MKRNHETCHRREASRRCRKQVDSGRGEGELGKVKREGVLKGFKKNTKLKYQSRVFTLSLLRGVSESCPHGIPTMSEPKKSQLKNLTPIWSIDTCRIGVGI